MKKLIIVMLVLVGFGMNVNAQTPYNPFTQNIHYAPEPTVAGFECGSTPDVVFTQGLLTADDATQFNVQALTVTVCVVGFQFEFPENPALTVSGSYASNFTWTIDPFAPNCLVGTQKQTLYGTGTDPLNPNVLSSGDVIVHLKVPETSPIGTILGTNVNLQVPGYMAAYNNLADDDESSFTQTYCPLRIAGTVFIDHTSDDIINGTPTATAGSTGLCANLIGNTGVVIDAMPIASNGTYEFLNVNPNSTYSVILSAGCGVVGNPAPTSTLPTNWLNTAEDCCDGSGSDGITDGAVMVPVTNATKLNVNFGIQPSFNLPVTLGAFTVNESNCNGLLTWRTLSEENTLKVEILRKDGNVGEFKAIGELKLKGYSNEPVDYSFLDRTVNKQSEAYQYRLKFIDIDGKETFSEVRSLTLNCGESNLGINVLPNPAKNQLMVSIQTGTEIADGELVKLDITDVSGRVVMAQSQIVTNGAGLAEFDITSLAKGNYILRFENVDTKQNINYKFTKE